MSKEIKETPFYVCPNNCPETWFFQEGTTKTVRKFTEVGEYMQDEGYDFTPTDPVSCYKCGEKAIIKTKKTTIIEEIIDPE